MEVVVVVLVAMVAMMVISGIVVVAILNGGAARGGQRGVGPAGVRWSVEVEPANEGEEMLAFALNDRQTGTLKITPSLVDLDGKTFKKDDGSPIAVEDVAISWASSDDAVASVEATDGGRTLTVKSGDTGSVILSGRMDYPGGVSKQVQYGVAVGNSDAADPEVTFDVADETPPTP